MRHGAKFRNCNIYTSYEEILQCKYKCRVQEPSVSDTIAKVPLQKPSRPHYETNSIFAARSNYVQLSQLMIINLLVKLSLVTDLMVVLVKLHTNRSLIVQVLNWIIPYSQLQ